MPKTLGAFEVGRVLARGGMSDVYTARHLVEGHDAVIKVVTVPGAPNEVLLREVRAVARLNHPAIVAVYDYGEVSETEAHAFETELSPGTLWLAMEFADRGTLEDVVELESWWALRHILLEILDALAHAHARGLIHRDLKPANVLLQQRDEETGLLLADFGIAHVVDLAGRVPETTDTIKAPSAGTPRYMAPEQVRGLWRDQGPWTDLYALGCVAWELATGGPVFDGETAVAVAFAHLSSQPGDFVSTLDVPPQFEKWLRVLLEKDGRLRYTCAADAAYALAQLGDAPPADSSRSIGSSLRTRKLQPLPTLGDLLDAPTLQLPSVELRAMSSQDQLPPASGLGRTVPVPRDWRPARTAKPLGGRTGLGLFGLRDIPLLGREAERDQLWRTLRDVTADRRARVIAITGDEGSGKSKLLRWFSERCAELGIATPLQVTHTPLASPAAGLALALSRHLRCGGLSESDTRERLVNVAAAFEAPDLDVGSLAGLLAATPVERAPHLTSPSERYTVMEAYLRAAARQRPLLLCIDDVQWGPDAIAFVQHLLNQPEDEDSNICIVMTARPDALEANPLADKRFRALQSHARAVRLELEALPEADHVALVTEQVGLTAELASALVSAAGSDTNYSLCVVADWVRRGVLRGGPDGYRAAGKVEFPRSLNEAWGARVLRFCAAFSLPGDVAEALEIAAVLGTEVDLDEWLSACAARGVRASTEIVERLVDAGLAARSDAGFGFVQTPITAVLVTNAKKNGRLAAIHRDCAGVITRGVRGSASAAERRALHLVRAGEIDDGLQQLTIAIDQRLQTSAYDEAVLLADIYHEHAPSPLDEAAIIVRARRADALRYLGDAAAAQAQAAGILTLARQIGSRRATAEGLRVLAGLEHGRGNLAQGIDQYSTALAEFERIGDPGGMAKCLHGRGWLHINGSDFLSARDDFARGIELASRAGAAGDVAWCGQGFAEAMAYCGDLEPAERAARRAIAEFRELGSRSGEGMTIASLANVDRERGSLSAARAGYHASIGMLSSFGSHLAAFGCLHLVVLELTAGEHDALRKAVTLARAQQLPPSFDLTVTLAEAALGTADDRRLQELLSVRGSTLHPMVWRALDGLQSSLDADVVLALRARLIDAAQGGGGSSGV